MRFYNPFKPHIIQVSDNCWMIRKLTVFGYEYFDREHGHWWLTPRFIIKYCQIPTKQEAEQRLGFAKL